MPVDDDAAIEIPDDRVSPPLLLLLLPSSISPDTKRWTERTVSIYRRVSIKLARGSRRRPRIHLNNIRVAGSKDARSRRFSARFRPRKNVAGSNRGRFLFKQNHLVRHGFFDFTFRSMFCSATTDGRTDRREDGDR